MRLFLFGLASGIALLTLTGYRRVSPRWLKWLLMASGVLLMSRYAMAARWPDAIPVASFSPWWTVTSIGLTLPGVFAIDQLIRHPAMTPKRLLRWYLLMLLAEGLALAVMGTVLAQMGLFIGLSGVCLVLRQKIPSPPIQWALLGLACSYALLGVNLFVAAVRWNSSPLLYSEMFALLAIWYAYETSARLQQTV